MDSATLERAMPGLGPARAAELVAGCNEAMLAGGITTKLRAAMFLAQVGHESVSLRFKAEIGHGAGHPYPPYYGRGFIQLTWRYNYAAFGAWAHSRGLVGDRNVFVAQPELVEQDRWAWLSAVWFWSAHNLNTFADRGDVQGATLVINGGTLGLEARTDRYFRALQFGDAICPTHPAAPEDELTMSQYENLKAALDDVRHTLDLMARGDKAPAGIPEAHDPHETHPANLVTMNQRITDIAAALDLAIRGDKAPPGVAERADVADTHPANLTAMNERLGRLEKTVARIAVKLDA